MRTAGASGRGCTGRIDDRAEAGRERLEHRVEPVGAPDQRQRAAPNEQAGGASHPWIEPGPGMRQGAAWVGRDAVTGGIVERRVHQHAGGAAGIQSGRGEGASPARDVKRDRADAGGEPVAAGILGGKRGEHGVDLDQRHRQPAHPPRQREAGGAYAGAEFDHMVAVLAAACRRQQDRVMADAMAPERLPQDEPAAQYRIVGEGTSVPVPTFVSHCSTLSYERRNQRDTSKHMILVWLWI